jgi:hypothetical protein
LITRTVSAQGALDNTGSIRTRYRVFLDAGYFNAATGMWNVDRDERLFWLDPGHQFSMTLSRSFSMNAGDRIAAQVFAWAIATSAGQLPGAGQEIGEGSLFEYTEPSAPAPPPPGNGGGTPGEPEPEPAYSIGQRVRAGGLVAVIGPASAGADSCYAENPWGEVTSRWWTGSTWSYTVYILGADRAVFGGADCTLANVIGRTFDRSEAGLAQCFSFQICGQ